MKNVFTIKNREQTKKNTMAIKMVDLSRQIKPIKAEIFAAIQGVFEATNFIQGEPVRKFEKNLAEWVGARYAISCANGTDALQLAKGLKFGIFHTSCQVRTLSQIVISDKMLW